MIKTESIQRTFVSTNDQEIEKVALQHNAEIIHRPDSLCGDNEPSESALLHALDYLREDEGLEPDIVVFLQCTSPLRKKNDIDNAIKLLLNKNADSLISGSKFEDFLFWKKRNIKWESINFDYKKRGQRQNRNPQFVENGSIYIFKPEVLKKYNNRIGGKMALYEMEFWQTWEIDTSEDISLI